VNKGFFTSIILSFCVFLSACEDPQEIGSEVFVQDIGVLYTDTLTVDASTILLDSIVTSNTANLLVGRYTDPTLGLVEASSYFHIANLDTLRSVVDTLGRKEVTWIRFPSKADSIRLILPYNLYQGDTLQRQTFKVTQLDDNALLDATKPYYNKDIAPVLKPTLLGQVQNVRIRPIKNQNIISGVDRFDTLRIPITDPTFINFIKSQRDLTVKDDVLIGTGFKNKIRGLALTSESANNAAIVGFSVNGARAIMRIFYNYKYIYTLRNKANSADSIRVTVDTTRANDLYVGLYSPTTGAPSNARFNKIATSRIGAYSKLINPTDALLSSQSSNQVVLQSSTGLGMKVKFPSLLKLKERQDIAINKAELVLEPNSSNYSVPTDLILIESTLTNRPVRSTSTGEGSLLFVSGEASTAAYVAKSNNYTFNVTSSLQNILSGRNKSNGWVLSADTFASSSTTARGPISGKSIVSSDVDRAVFDSKKVKLKVYYTYVGK
jgi:Domain of unknown function (DUF4270)